MGEPVRSTTGIIHWMDGDRSACHQIRRETWSPRPGYPVTCLKCQHEMGSVRRIGAHMDELIEDRRLLGEALGRIARGEVDDPTATARIALGITNARYEARLSVGEIKVS